MFEVGLHLHVHWLHQHKMSVPLKTVFWFQSSQWAEMNCTCPFEIRSVAETEGHHTLSVFSLSDIDSP